MGLFTIISHFNTLNLLSNFTKVIPTYTHNMDYPSISVNKIKSEFPKPTLVIIMEEPTHEQPIQIYNKLCNNAACASPNLGIRRHIQFSLVITINTTYPKQSPHGYQNTTWCIIQK